MPIKIILLFANGKMMDSQKAQIMIKAYDLFNRGFRFC